MDDFEGDTDLDPDGFVVNDDDASGPTDDTSGGTPSSPLGGQVNAANAASPANSTGSGILGGAANAIGGLINVAATTASNYEKAQLAAQASQKVAKYVLIGGVVVVALFLLTRKKA